MKKRTTVNFFESFALHGVSFFDSFHVNFHSNLLRRQKLITPHLLFWQLYQQNYRCVLGKAVRFQLCGRTVLHTYIYIHVYQSVQPLDSTSSGFLTAQRSAWRGRSLRILGPPKFLRLVGRETPFPALSDLICLSKKVR